MFRRRAVGLFILVGLLLVTTAWLVVRTLEKDLRSEAAARIAKIPPRAKGVAATSTAPA